MTTQTRNEAAERLLFWVPKNDSEAKDDFDLAVREALAAERRATVERIRAALDANPWYAKAPRSQLNAILDEEAK